jgi:hypothetical protein
VAYHGKMNTERDRLITARNPRRGQYTHDKRHDIRCMEMLKIVSNQDERIRPFVT